MVKIKFSKKADRTFHKLKKSKRKEDRILVDAIDYKLGLIEVNPVFGVKIRQKQMPSDLKVKSLFRVELPCYWRMLYTLENNDLKIVAFVVDISNHKKYDRLMGY